MLLDHAWIVVRARSGHHSGSGTRGGVAGFVMRNITIVLIGLATCLKVLRILEVSVDVIVAQSAGFRNDTQQ